MDFPLPAATAFSPGGGQASPPLWAAQHPVLPLERSADGGRWGDLGLRIIVPSPCPSQELAAVGTGMFGIEPEAGLAPLLFPAWWVTGGEKTKQWGLESSSGQGLCSAASGSLEPSGRWSTSSCTRCAHSWCTFSPQPHGCPAAAQRMSPARPPVVSPHRVSPEAPGRAEAACQRRTAPVHSP